ncbi:hypothetical protein H311_02461 [Anncaliia algerae PRA109]|nr:hypothetical protein H311_02461 [Anncaliia algerae PRA109]
MMNSRVQRWKLLLEDLNVQIIHTPGKNNTPADYLSRCYTIKPSKSAYEELLNYVSQEQKKWIKDITQEYETLTYKGIQILVSKQRKIIIPISFNKDFLRYIHYFLGHPGEKTCYNTLKRTFQIKKNNTYL